MFALRCVRLTYEKKGNAKYISVLDMNRFMLRAIKRSGLPVWYTEGFNPHFFITFIMPLSLGFETDQDIMEFKMDDDSVSNEEIATAFAKVMPANMKVIGAKDPVLKSKELKYAKFTVTLATERVKEIKAFFETEQILVKKTTKKGIVNTVDLKEKIHFLNIAENENVQIELTLPAGSEENINPNLILDAMSKSGEIKFEVVNVTRNLLLDINFDLFE